MAAAALALVAVGVLGACSPSREEADAGAEPALGSIAMLSSTDTLTLPLDQYIPSGEDATRMQAAYRVRLRQCVAGFGMNFAAPAARAQPVSLGPNARRYGVTDLEMAALYGFRLAPELIARKDPQPPLSAAVETVLSGKGQSTVNGKPVPAGGCVAQAQKDVKGSDITDDSLADRLSRESFARSEADSRTRAAMTRWSTCMRQKGFSYTTPNNAVADPRFASTARATPAEISAAKADIACKQQTNLVGIWAAVETAYQQRLISANQSGLAAVRQLHQTQLRNAAAVLGSAG